MIEHLRGLAAIADRYDGFILDLWGVIHDGVAPYPGAIDCLARLRGAGKRAVLLSNAPRRAHVAQAGLRAMGIADDLYAACMTSGEATHLALRTRADPWFAALGPRVFHLGPERDRSVLEDLPLVLADGPADADFVLNTGPDDTANPSDPAAFDAVLEDCRAASLPMLCANPDLIVLRSGVRTVCAGTLALRYRQMGGVVRMLGKPDPAIYAPVLGLLGVPRARVLAVGDALHTDVAGAAAAGIDACWVLGGIHGLTDRHPDAEAEARAEGLIPVATIPGFVWGDATARDSGLVSGGSRRG